MLDMLKKYLKSGGHIDTSLHSFLVFNISFHNFSKLILRINSLLKIKINFLLNTAVLLPTHTPHFIQSPSWYVFLAYWIASVLNSFNKSKLVQRSDCVNHVRTCHWLFEIIQSLWVFDLTWISLLPRKTLSILIFTLKQISIQII